MKLFVSVKFSTEHAAATGPWSALTAAPKACNEAAEKEAVMFAAKLCSSSADSGDAGAPRACSDAAELEDKLAERACSDPT